MYQIINLNNFHEKLSIFNEESKTVIDIKTEEGGTVKGTKIEVGKRLTISNPQKWSFSIIVESQQNNNVKGEVVLTTFELLSLKDKVELTHSGFKKYFT